MKSFLQGTAILVVDRSTKTKIARRARSSVQQYQPQHGNTVEHTEVLSRDHMWRVGGVAGCRLKVASSDAFCDRTRIFATNAPSFIILVPRDGSL
jgi:hypothetical protein